MTFWFLDRWLDETSGNETSDEVNSGLQEIAMDIFMAPRGAALPGCPYEHVSVIYLWSFSTHSHGFHQGLGDGC